jgi:hypothetical protein
VWTGWEMYIGGNGGIKPKWRFPIKVKPAR